MSEIELKARELLASCLNEWGHHQEAGNVRDGEDLESYEFELRVIGQLLRFGFDTGYGHATRAPQWQPIETAPKDGTAILLTNGKDVAEGHWYFEEGGTTEHRDLEGRYIDQTESEGYDGWLDWDGGMQPDPTHWMPLPSPPEVNG